MKRKIVVAVTGASGVTYAVRLVEVLLGGGCDVHLSISAAAAIVFEQELDLAFDLDDFDPVMLISDKNVDREDIHPQRASELGKITYHHYRDLTAPIASGSFLTDGMVVCPCSCGTLSAVVHGTSANLIHRAAEVHLKERRKLVLVPRETPLSLTHLENLTRAAQAGAVVLPAMPGFYHGANTIADLVDFVVARICDQLAVPHRLIRRWGS